MPKDRSKSSETSEIVRNLYTALRDDRVSFLELSQKYIKPYLEAFATGDLEQITALVQASEIIQEGEGGISLNDALAERHLVENRLCDIFNHKYGALQALYSMNRYLKNVLQHNRLITSDTSSSQPNPSIKDMHASFMESRDPFRDCTDIDAIVAKAKEESSKNIKH